MSEILRRVQTLVLGGDWLASEHGYGEILADDFMATVVVAGIAEGDGRGVCGPAPWSERSDPAAGPGRAPHSRRLGHPCRSAASRRPGDGLQAGSGALGCGPQGAETEMTRKRTKLVQVGKYAAEVEVELIEDDTAWSPYLSPADVTKLDAVRLALRRGDLGAAETYGTVFELVPVKQA
ncbi:hypothetical protein J2S22_005887 [Rhodoplanes tepidamans]|uniref:Uncharacterized protein n=2 Tax=Rhodoplanes TaxID=29407 RepID=A0ABT5JJU9_RHOTP|nr:hypothetical protein [Rhodoplanes tepidamans]MDC7790005.1 hypothetical protein [Rhodoplanes tepidamans]MDQ0358931.1 hypothetical protein [Rhodoplanes tepidamans]